MSGEKRITDPYRTTIEAGCPPGGGVPVSDECYRNVSNLKKEKDNRLTTMQETAAPEKRRKENCKKLDEGRKVSRHLTVKKSAPGRLCKKEKRETNAPEYSLKDILSKKGKAPGSRRGGKEEFSQPRTIAS